MLQCIYVYKTYLEPVEDSDTADRGFDAQSNIPWFIDTTKNDSSKRKNFIKGSIKILPSSKREEVTQTQQLESHATTILVKIIHWETCVKIVARVSVSDLIEGEREIQCKGERTGIGNICSSSE